MLSLLLAIFCQKVSLSLSKTEQNFWKTPSSAQETDHVMTKKPNNKFMSNGVQSRLTMPPTPASPKTWTSDPTPGHTTGFYTPVAEVFHYLTRELVNPITPVFAPISFDVVTASTLWPDYEEHTLFYDPVSINLDKPPPPPPRDSPPPPPPFINHPMIKPNDDEGCGSENTIASSDQEKMPDPGIQTVGDKDSVNGKGPMAPVLISSCNGFLAVLALILNTILVLHYKKHLTNIPSLLYFRNGLCDIISAIGFLLQVPSVISILKEHNSAILPLLSFWISTVSVRMSVFMNCLLGVVRCINILSPFYLINKKIITFSTSLYLLIWTSIASLDVWVYITKITLQNRVYLVKSLVLKAEAGFSLTSLTGSGGAVLTSPSQGEIVLVQFLTPLVLPALLCFVLMVFQILHLRKQSFAVTPRVSRGKENEESNKEKDPKQRTNKEKDLKHGTNKRKNKAATSILIVTIIYVLTSTVSVAMWLVIYRDHLGGGEKIKKLSWSELSVIYFSTHFTSILLYSHSTHSSCERKHLETLHTRYHQQDFGVFHKKR